MWFIANPQRWSFSLVSFPMLVSVHGIIFHSIHWLLAGLTEVSTYICCLNKTQHLHAIMNFEWMLVYQWNQETWFTILVFGVTKWEYEVTPKTTQQSWHRQFGELRRNQILRKHHLALVLQESHFQLLTCMV